MANAAHFAGTYVALGTHPDWSAGSKFRPDLTEWLSGVLFIFALNGRCRLTDDERLR